MYLSFDHGRGPADRTRPARFVMHESTSLKEFCRIPEVTPAIAWNSPSILTSSVKLCRDMATGPEHERGLWLSVKSSVETLLSKMKELQLSLDNSRQRREINFGASRVLEEAVSSAYVVAANLKTTLSPLWAQAQSGAPRHELEAPVQVGAEATKSCSRCGRGVNAEFKLCPYCGYELRPKSCQGCGKEVIPEFKFCPHCGKRSEKVEVPGLEELHPEVRDLR